MKTASRILGTAFFLEGFEVQDAPRYGAERRGAPIFAYVRASRTPIHERGIIRRPDLVIVADETLVPVPAAGVLLGLTETTVIAINSTEKSDVWRRRLNVPGSVLTLPAESEDPAELRFVGATCAGAAACLLGVIPRDALERAIRDELATMRAEIVAENLERAIAAYDFVESHASCVKEGGEIRADTYEGPGWIDLPFEDARASAPDIHAAGTSVQVRTGLWRTMRPVIDRDLCNRCWWVCSTLCPDSVIGVSPEGVPEIDYSHCKGCLVCVAVCPPHAIAALPEHEAQAEKAREAEA
jgi:pyruvate ferredoxin oxidoreductase gamma subunit